MHADAMTTGAPRADIPGHLSMRDAASSPRLTRIILQPDDRAARTS